MGETPGDPEGRRIARKRAIKLSEANRVALALKSLLTRADVDTTALDSLIADVTNSELNELMRAYGKVSSRKRFKHAGGRPLHESRAPNFIYIDESGRADPNYPGSYFALGAVAMQEPDIAAYKVAANELKHRFFGRTDFTFHEPLMRNHAQAYWFEGDEYKQKQFCEELDQLVSETNFVAFGVGIRKSAFDEFMAEGSDPYLPFDVYAVAIHMLLERYIDYLATSPIPSFGRVTFESQGPKEDAEHQHEYVNLLLDGTQWVPDSAFRNWLETAGRFERKSGTDPMELADMFSRDLYEWVRGDCHAWTPRRWGIFSRKIYRSGDGRMGRFGVKIFPDEDIRDLIEAHREYCATGK